ncbi:MAG: hypothetical protein SFV19_17285 [Rhodospirillaceae bacterium]|nr:hypothetical protein [Rhodospirillaceae bacterium]
MATGRFIGYSPTSLKVINGQPTRADEASIAEDLKVLRARFDGLITYASLNGAERIPDIAATLGYRAVIMGVYDPADATERAHVAAAARRQPNIVAGVSLGNETVYGGRGTFADLATAMDTMRQLAPNLAIATTEPFHLLLRPDAATVLRTSDILLANVHPVFEPWFNGAPDANAAEFVVNVARDLSHMYCGPILVKETGVPTAPADAGFTPARQAGFYRALLKQFPPDAMRAFAYFSAFDAPWRVNDVHPVPGHHPEEAHWGLYDEVRNPKPVVGEIPALKP